MQCNATKRDTKTSNINMGNVYKKWHLELRVLRIKL